MNASWTRFRGWFVFLLVLAAVAGIITFQWRRPRSRPEPLMVASATPTVVEIPTPQPLRVYVSGAVVRPDVYDLPPGSIVKDAIHAAGGATEDADLDCINLALPLSDALHVYVPRVGEASPPAPDLRSPSSGGGTVNLNTATATELETLPGIGPVLAQRIVEYRQTHGPFQTIEDVMDVAGIGPATFEEIQDLISTD
jgi:competence protein ComEA